MKKERAHNRILFFAKILFGIGICASIILPQYAYYWKRTTMEVIFFYI